MQAPVDDDEPPIGPGPEEPPFVLWALGGGVLVLLYVLVFLLVRAP